jgi:nitrogen fixation NifU-like protein
MSDLRELYQQVIIDHGRRPRNFGELKTATCKQVGHNPLCGDKLLLSLECDGDTIKAVKFSREGCAISMASASLMTEMIQGKSKQDVLCLFEQVHQMLTEGTDDKAAIAALGKLAVLQGVCAYPARVKCATLAWHTLQVLVKGGDNLVTTE